MSIGKAVDHTEEPIVALRGWYLRFPLILVSIGFSVEWTPGKRMTARCANPDMEGFAPHSQCSCGIYATNSLKVIADMNPHIIGSVELTGKIIIHENGYRAQEAKIKDLTVVIEKYHPYIEDLAEMYQCKVEAGAPLPRYRHPEPQEILDSHRREMDALKALKDPSTILFILTKRRAQLTQHIKNTEKSIANFHVAIKQLKATLDREKGKVARIDEVRQLVKRRIKDGRNPIQ